jgi:hypothetical protein
VILVGIDDTDVVGSPGTNQVARLLMRSLGGQYDFLLAIRHQLLVDPRVPYTSHNSSASLLLKPPPSGSLSDLTERLRELLRQQFIAGSDPGLCVADGVSEAIVQFALRCQQEVVSQQEARQLAAQCDVYLEGLGGSEDGVIGALAAVGLAAGGNDGRVVGIGRWPDDLSGPQQVAVLLRRGVDEIRCIKSDEPIDGGLIDVGKRLRPNYRGGRVVLFAAPAPPKNGGDGPRWQAVRFS